MASRRKETVSQHVKEEVWRLYGAEVCWCCQHEKISVNNKHFGHIVSERNGGKADVENLRPVCPSCNLRMGTSNMYDFMSKEGYPIRDVAVIGRIFSADPELMKALRGKHVCAIPKTSGYKFILVSKLFVELPFLRGKDLTELFETSEENGVHFHFIVKPEYIGWIRHHLNQSEIDRLSARLSKTQKI